MDARPDEEPAAQHGSTTDLDEAARRRLERDWELPMSERLARLHELGLQMTSIVGAAKRR